MKRLFHPVAALLLVPAFFIFPACQKEHCPQDLPHDVKFCPILALKSIDPANPSVIQSQYSIHYNTAGNPVDMLFTVGDPYAKFDYHFRYDQFNRLTDYIQNYTGNTGSIIWHRYSYPSNRTVVDSVFNYGNALITDPAPDPTDFPSAVVLTLDEKGRIVKSQAAGSPTFTRYQYDGRGNLVRDGISYDNKVNIYRTNYVWQFIFNDFSTNNPSSPLYNGGPTTITSYNSVGLPLVMNGVSYLFDHIFYTSELDIDYACDAGHVAP
ncbi:MAG TPA: hypothetical protein VL832_17115 [Puia sp.]|nr:hypothetical protein [Puia sp.]